MVLLPWDHHIECFFESPNIGVNGFQNFEGDGQRWFGCLFAPKKCVKSNVNRAEHVYEHPWGPHLLNPCILSHSTTETTSPNICSSNKLNRCLQIIHFSLYSAQFILTIGNFQWFLRRPSPLNVSLAVWPLPSMVFATFTLKWFGTIGQTMRWFRWIVLVYHASCIQANGAIMSASSP